jgi:hypothetical protein
VRVRIAVVCALAAGFIGCGSSSNTIGVALRWQQDVPEITHCHTFKLPNLTPVEIERIRVQFPAGSHHVHIYRSEEASPDTVVDCTAGLDWRRWSLVFAVQAQPMDWTLPEGVTLSLEPKQQLLVQVHWLNYTGGTIDRTIEMDFFPAQKPGRQHLQSLLGLSQDVYLGPHDRKTVSGWIPLPDGAEIVALMGHFHSRGLTYAVDVQPFGGNVTKAGLYQAQDQDTLQFQRFSPLVALGPGEGLSYRCDFANPTNQVITWGPEVSTQEHCNLAVYFVLPADRPPALPLLQGDVASLDGPSLLAPGARQTVTVHLAAPAGPLGVEVVMESDPPGFLDLPTRVQVPPWQDRADADVVCNATQGSARILATTGATVVAGEVEVGAP